MEVLRTPDECFVNLPEYNFSPHYLNIPDGEDGTLRLHYVDEGDKGAAPVLLMHGEPSWSYLYRKMIPPLVAAGYRVIAPDLIGFGRSDKPTKPEDYTYQRHVDWITAVLLNLDLQNITLFCQDWGGLIGLRLIADYPERFQRAVVANTGLPTGDQEMPEEFHKWVQFSQNVSKLPVGRIINNGTVTQLSSDIIAAYKAPFPDESYKAGARIFPSLVPITPDDPAAATNRKAWRVLAKWQKPLLTAFSDSDPITKGGQKAFQRLVAGAKGQQHVTIKDAGHFLQEDKGEEIAQVIIDFIRATE